MGGQKNVAHNIHRREMASATNSVHSVRPPTINLLCIRDPMSIFERIQGCCYAYTFVWVCNYVWLCACMFICVYIFIICVLESEVCICVIQCVWPVAVWVYVSATILQSVFYGLAWMESKAPSCFRSTLNHGSPHCSLILSDSHRPDLTTSVCPCSQ